VTLDIRRLGSGDEPMAEALNALFAEAFDDRESYADHRPSTAYLQQQLARPDTIVLLAMAGGDVAGGLVAYVLPKLEQERSEIYIYDLAVAETHRRQGIATALIASLRQHAADTGAWVIYVQADLEDEPAVALYAGLGRREDVLHFDISPQVTR
jgi:aminoglycoside 3-N-acetyltransferase I